eukprot:Hpha_TRINITY_DN13055_c0_g1::TRINITY_DN13055_c0_g1_i1::g.68985::m.68985/K05941/E2.3.2.15; glutathione gamma-glutamylcysteinyltransferase
MRRCAAGLARGCAAAKGAVCGDCPLRFDSRGQVLVDVEDICGASRLRCPPPRSRRIGEGTDDGPQFPNTLNGAPDSILEVGPRRRVQLSVTSDVGYSSPPTGATDWSQRIWRRAARAAGPAQLMSPTLRSPRRALAASRPVPSSLQRELHTAAASPAPVFFSTAEGRELLRRALDAGFAESYFALSEQFEAAVSEREAAAAVLATVLNALGIDPLHSSSTAVPNPVWKGVWRWFTEPQLAAGRCGDLGEAMSFAEFCCLAQRAAERSGRTALAAFPSGSITPDAFRFQLASAATSRSAFMVCAFDRWVLTGAEGEAMPHFAPVAAYDPQSDRVLLLDPARTRTRPYWVSVDALWRAVSARGGGHVLVSTDETADSVASASTTGTALLAAADCGCNSDPAPAPSVSCGLLTGLTTVLMSLVQSPTASRRLTEMDTELRENARLQEALRATSLGVHLAAAARARAQVAVDVAAATAAVLSFPAEAFAALSRREQELVAGLRASSHDPVLSSFISDWRPRFQWLRLQQHSNNGCSCGVAHSPQLVGRLRPAEAA